MIYLPKSNIESGTWIKTKGVIKLNKPVLLVGLPGVGSVGKLVVEHLKNEFNANKFAILYSNHLPHRTIMLKSGGLRMASIRFYHIKPKKKGMSDIVLLTGDDQPITPEGQHEVNLKLVDFFKNELGGKYIYTIGGYAPAEPITGTPKVFGNATDKKVINSFKGSKVLFGKTKGMIWGSAGMIVVLGKMRGIPGICLMGETAIMDLDAAAAKSVLAVLSERLEIPINTDSLDKIINKTAKALKEIEQQMSMSLQMPPQDASHGGKPDSSLSYIR
jgi:hypothetical protein